MGFTTGFTGGVTLTLGLAYLTVLAHERNRQTQAQALRFQSRVLQGLLEPSPLPPPRSRAELAREERSTLVETAKDRWNDEIENAVRWVQKTDWNEVREGVEGAVTRLFDGPAQRSREIIEGGEDEARSKIQEAIGASNSASRGAIGQISAGIDEAIAATTAAAENAGTALKHSASRTVESTGINHDAAASSKHSSGGTVDAAREAVRHAISKGIEKGKDAFDKAQAAVGMASEKIESRVQSTSLGHVSAVEKALHERYEKKDTPKTVEEALEERYKPIDARDNTTLRGL